MIEKIQPRFISDTNDAKKMPSRGYRTGKNITIYSTI